MNNNCVICSTVKNCEKYIKKVIKNIVKIINDKIFDTYYIVIYFDNSSDNSLSLLIKYKNKYKLNMHIHHNTIFQSKFRTHRLAFGRNYCLYIINKYFNNYKYFIMMDFDDVCSNDINLNVLQKYIKNDSNWDALSFNKNNYYDLWALSIRPYIFSYIHFDNPNKVLNNTQKYIKDKLEKLKKDELLSCYSAFNGFCIYKTDVFKDCVYDGNIRLDLIPKEYLRETINTNKSNIMFNKYNWLNSYHEDCEHRSFHFQAIHTKNARICISPEILIN